MPLVAQVVAKEIEDALCEKTGNVEAPTDVEVPDRLISTEDVAQLMKREPKFVPVRGQITDRGR